MTWPTPISTADAVVANTDAGTDSPASARDNIKLAMDLVNEEKAKINSILAFGEPLPKAGGALTGAVFDAKTAISASDINLNLGGYFSKTISGATTLTVSNVPAAGSAAAFVLDLTNGGSAVITWWSGVKWPGGVAPTLTAAGRDSLVFYSFDAGTTWTGLLAGRDIK